MNDKPKPKRAATPAQLEALMAGRTSGKTGRKKSPNSLEQRVIRLPPDQWSALEHQAALWGCSVAEALRTCVTAHLERIETQRSRMPTISERPTGS